VDTGLHCAACGVFNALRAFGYEPVGTSGVVLFTKAAGPIHFRGLPREALHGPQAWRQLYSEHAKYVGATAPTGTKRNVTIIYIIANNIEEGEDDSDCKQKRLRHHSNMEYRCALERH
jgi:hypothetical protein